MNARQSNGSEVASWDSSRSRLPPVNWALKFRRPGASGQPPKPAGVKERAGDEAGTANATALRLGDLSVRLHEFRCYSVLLTNLRCGTDARPVCRRGDLGRGGS